MEAGKESHLPSHPLGVQAWAPDMARDRLTQSSLNLEHMKKQRWQRIGFAPEGAVASSVWGQLCHSSGHQAAPRCNSDRGLSCVAFLASSAFSAPGSSVFLVIL